MPSSTSFRLLPVAAISLLLAQAALAAPSYRIEVLGRANGVAPKWAGSISDNDSVAGVGVDTPTGDSTMFRSRRGKKVEGLVETLNVHYPGSPQINNAGVVVGRYQRDYVEYGGMWTSDGVLTDLAPVLGCDDSRNIYPKSIDDKGALLLSVTCTVNGVKTEGGFVVRDGVVTQLPGPDDKSVAVEAMNKGGQVIGELWGSNYRTQAFIWQDG
jgi:probable HAF family extracellular repeat protein